MPNISDDVVLGGIYRTRKNQERLVTAIGNGKVHYLSRGGNVKNKWGYGSSKAGTNLKTFVEACSEYLGLADVGPAES